jgi:hypothetical protein
MSIQMVCPNIRCRHMHSFPPEARGQVIKCLKCTTRFRIPAPRVTLPAAADVPKEFKVVPAAPFVF